MDNADGCGDLEAVITALVAAPRHVSPAVALYQELTAAPAIAPEQMLLLQPRIDAAIQAGQGDLDAFNAALRALVATQARPAQELPDGF